MSQPFLLPKWFGPFLLVLIALLFVSRNLPWHLDDYDQAKQAFTSFEMVEKGHWWFQHTPTDRIATKPPLAGWISSLLYLITGNWPLAWRIPSLVGAGLLLVILWRRGRDLLAQPLGGMIACAAFSLTVFSPRIASLVRTDMLLTACIVFAGSLVLEKVQSAQPWLAGEKWMLFGSILASMLIKGPIAYAFLLPGLVAFAVCSRRWNLPNHTWSGAWPWWTPLLVFAAWAGIGIWLSPEFYDQVVRKEFLGRFSAGEHAVHQPRNPFFYLGLILLRWQPWSLILLGLACLRPVREAFRRDPVLLWLSCWALGGLLVMSIVPSKRFDRILPVIPPLCLLLVAMLKALPPRRTIEFHRDALLAILLSLLISGSYAGYLIKEGYRTQQGALVDFGSLVRQTVGPNLDRLNIVNGKDEGMLLYTGKTEFTRQDDAFAAWQREEIDYLVLPERAFNANQKRLSPFLLQAELPQIVEKGSGYRFLQRPVPNPSQP